MVLTEVPINSAWVGWNHAELPSHGGHLLGARLSLSQVEARFSAGPCNSKLLFVPDCWMLVPFPGFPLAVTALPEGCLSRTIHFLQTSTAPTDQLPRPKVQLLVLCTDGSLHLVIISGPRKSRTVLLADR